MRGIVVGLSGGVDSAVAALTLMDAGWQVHGTWLRMFPEQQGEAHARAVGAGLGIPMEVLDLSERFRREVLGPVAAIYAGGRTPNPCVLCNPTVKLAALAEQADALGCEAIATGHYARVVDGTGGVSLCKGRDPQKDQSYFLARVPEDLLRRLVLPLAQETKAETRRRAHAAQLIVADAPESQETCFAGDGDLGAFLEGPCGLSARPGPVVLEDGREIGRHPGLHRFTVGQRRGLGIAWHHPLYVLRLEPEADRLVVGQREALAATRVTAVAPVWGAVGIPENGRHLEVKIRYRSPGMPCVIEGADPLGFRVHLDRSAAAVTPGQAAVLYDGDRVVGAGWIEGGQ